MQDKITQVTKLKEIYSQCWESEEYKKKFMENPIPFFEEYGLEYSPNVEYKILDSTPRTTTYVLPYEGIKDGIIEMTDVMLKPVEELTDGTPKQVIPENWTVQMIQNTEDTVYLVIPISPDELATEEMANVTGGGYGFVADLITSGKIDVAFAISAIIALDLVIAVAAAVFSVAAAAIIALVGAAYVAVIAGVVVVP